MGSTRQPYSKKKKKNSSEVIETQNLRVPKLDRHTS